MTQLLSDQLIRTLRPAERCAPMPVPVRSISNGEFMPFRQTERQRQVARRLRELADSFGSRVGMSRRQFLASASGFAAAFLAFNDVYGATFAADEAEASDPNLAAARASSLTGQFVFDAQVHFIRADAKPGSSPANMLNLRQYAADAMVPELRGRTQQLSDLQFENFLKEVFLDSDTRIALLSGVAADREEDWFLSNAQIARARDIVNGIAGTKRLYCHTIIAPGHPGWMDDIERAIEEIRPDSWKGYTMGDPNGPSMYRWRLDDEKLIYPALEKMVKSGIRTICLHKGLLPPDAERLMPGITRHADVSDVGRAAKDWPQMNFMIYHAGFNVPDTPQALELFESNGRIDWVSDLAGIPDEFGVTNVYADIGASFALAVVNSPRLAAAMVSTLVKGLGSDKVLWGTDSVWFGSPQWQIEAFRRLELPEDLRRRFDLPPLGPVDGPVKKAILGENAARCYGLEAPSAAAEADRDRLTTLKTEYRAAGPVRSDVAYGYVR